MMLLAPEQRELLLANERLIREPENLDPHPVVKLFTPDAGAIWLITELDPHDPSIAFGLCDFGLIGLEVERNLHFVTKQPISGYADPARRAGRIIA